MKYLMSVLLVMCLMGGTVYAEEMKPWEKRRAAKKKNEAKKEAQRQRAKDKEAREVGAIKKRDQDIMQNRIESKDFDFVSIGPAWFISPDYAPNDPAFNIGGGRLWEVTPNAAVKFGINAITDLGLDAFLFTTGLGANYYLNASNFSPFLGADMGLGFGGAKHKDPIAEHDEYFFGFTMGVSGGLVLFRTSTTHLIIEPNMQWLLRGSYPSTVGIKLSIANSGMFGGF